MTTQTSFYVIITYRMRLNKPNCLQQTTNTTRAQSTSLGFISSTSEPTEKSYCWQNYKQAFLSLRHICPGHCLIALSALFNCQLGGDQDSNDNRCTIFIYFFPDMCRRQLARQGKLVFFETLLSMRMLNIQ